MSREINIAVVGAKMSNVQLVRVFITERLTAAATEIFGVFEQTIVQYEEEIHRQRKLLDIFMKPQIKLHKIDASQQHSCKLALTDQQLCNQEGSSSLHQKEPETPHVIQQLCTNNEGQHLTLTQNPSIETAEYDESSSGEPEPNCDVVPSYNAADTDVSQQHYCKEEFHADQQVCNQQRDSNLDQEEPKPLGIKEEPCITHEEELLVLKQETTSSLLTANYDERDHGEPQPNSDEGFSENTTDMGKKSLKCQICGKAYQYPLRLKAHEKTHTNEKSHKTLVKSFKHSSNAAAHMKRLTGEKPFSCKICGKRFPQSSHCIFHIRTHTGEKPYSCKICGRRFTQHNNAVRHTRTHTGERPYPCKICGKRFRHRVSAVRHGRTHSDEMSDSCKVCGKSFSHPLEYFTHMRTHSGEKPYLCKICGKCFRIRPQLTVHMRTHTGEKPYSCNICGKRFTQQGNSLRHMRTHTGEKPYSCKICGKVFRYSYDVTVHMRSHTGERPYSCEICGNSYSKRGHIITHMRTHPGERAYAFKMYGKTFSGMSLK